MLDLYELTTQNLHLYVDPMTTTGIEHAHMISAFALAGLTVRRLGTAVKHNDVILTSLVMSY